MTTEPITRKQMEDIRPERSTFTLSLESVIATIDQWEPLFRHVADCPDDWVTCPVCAKARKALEAFDG